jgi:hypothetical protein
MSQFISPADVLFSAGTWTDTQAVNVWSANRTAADVAFNIYIPIKIPQNSVALKGSKLVSIDIFWVVTTTALDSLAAAIYQATLPANGAAHAAPTAVTFTYDTGHDAAAERLTLDEHKMTLTITTPAWLDDDDVYFVEIQADPAIGSVFKFHGARANFTFRV